LQASLQKVDVKQKNHALHGVCFLFAKPKQGDHEAASRRMSTPATPPSPSEALAKEGFALILKASPATVDKVHQILSR